MDVGTIGYLIMLHLNGYPSVLKSSCNLTLYCVKGVWTPRPNDLCIDLLKLVMYAGEHNDISVALYVTNYR